MPDRFGLDRNGDGLFDYDYSLEFINPSAWVVNFDGCASTPGSSPIVLYEWDLAGLAGVSRPTCQMEHPPAVFPALGTYPVTLTVTAQDGQKASTTQNIEVKDILIVSLGDSLASGEGNPDVPKPFGFNTEPKWEDKLCHRSANAGPARAALAIERSDPKSSVTFVHLACSGAAILAGLLTDYVRPEPPDNVLLRPQVLEAARLTCRVPYHPEFAGAICPGGNRRIDALTINIGVNDLGFLSIIVNCLTSFACDTDQEINRNLDAGLAALPGLYQLLADKISSKLNVGTTYIPEYFDPTTNDDGTYCSDILGGISAAEAKWASEKVIGGLNAAIAAAASAHGWDYVGDIARRFIGHGYCADDHWIVRLGESLDNQGDADGTLHANGSGHAVYSTRLFEEITNPGPTFTALNGFLFGGDIAGENGWFIGSCALGQCSSDEVDVTVLAKDPDGLVAWSNRIDGVGGCGAGATSACTFLVIEPRKNREIGWFIALKSDGTHRLDFSATDAKQHRTTFPYQIKVDLHDPSASAALTAGTAGNGGWYRSAVEVTVSGADAPNGSGLARLEYSLDGGSLAVGPSGLKVTISGDGAHGLSYDALDFAGRRSAAQSLTVRIDTTAPAVKVLSASDGTFSYTPEELANGILTNASALAVTYEASDPTSGIAAVRVGAVSSPAATGTLTVPLTPGTSTHTLTAEDVAGNATSLPPFSVASVPPGTFTGGVAPQGGGFWMNAVKTGKSSEGDMAAFLAQADLASQAFGVSLNRYADATMANYLDYLSPAPRPTMDEKVRRELLIAWLDLVSGREPAAQSVDLAAAREWPTVVKNTGGSSITTALNVVREAERRLAESPPSANLEALKNVLEALNSGSLNR